MVSHNTIGAEELRWTYTGSWSSDAVNHWSSTGGSAAALNFTGLGVEVYGSKAAHHGIVEILVDGASQGMYDLYSSVRAEDVLVASIKNLADGPHTVTYRATDTKNASSTNDTVSLTKAVVDSTGTAPVYADTFTDEFRESF